MSDKAAKIARMLEMQKMFQEYERENGVTQQDYYASDEGHPLHGYRQEYLQLADDVCNMAHADKNSNRD